MAWEWVAPVATFASGATGMWFTYRTSRNQSKSNLDAVLQQIRESHNAELLKEKRKLFAEFFGALSEASYLTMTIQSANISSMSAWEKISDKTWEDAIKGSQRLFPADMPLDQRNEIIAKTLEEVKPKIAEIHREQLTEKGIPRHPLVAINFKELWRLAAQVNMSSRADLTELTHGPIVKLLETNALNNPKIEDIKSNAIQAEVRIHLLGIAMQKELAYTPSP